MKRPTGYKGGDVADSTPGIMPAGRHLSARGKAPFCPRAAGRMPAGSLDRVRIYLKIFNPVRLNFRPESGNIRMKPKMSLKNKSVE